MIEHNHSILEHLEFCVIDLETTGSFPSKDRIIDIGLVKVSGFNVGDSKNFLVNPKMRIPRFVQRLTKISQRDVENAQTIDEVIDEVVDFIGDSILVAHNISFDIPFLNGVLERLNKPKLSNQTLCTNVMTKNLVPEMISSNLTYLNQIFELPKHKAHRALADAIMTADLLVFYLKFFSFRNITKVNQLYYPAQKYEFHKRLFHKDDLSELSQVAQTVPEAVITFVDEDSKILYSIPLTRSLKNESYSQLFQEKVQSLNWSKVKVQLTSCHFESLQVIKGHFYKFPKKTRDELFETMLNQYQVLTNSGPAKKNDYQYMIAPHMIDGQFELHLNFTAKLKSKLLFKYPKHQKKLLNQMRKYANLKKRAHKRGLFDEVIQKYLQGSEKEYLYLYDKDIIDNPENSWKKISSFLEKKRVISNAPIPIAAFPIEHL